MTSGRVNAAAESIGRVLSAGTTITSVLPSKLTRVPGRRKSRLFERVHPRLVGGEKDIGRRALLNLAGERAGSAEVKSELVAASLFVCRGQFAERVGQAGGGVDGQLRGARSGCLTEQDGAKEQSEAQISSRRGGGSSQWLNHARLTCGGAARRWSP